MTEGYEVAGRAGWLDPLVELVREEEAHALRRRERRRLWLLVAGTAVVYDVTFAWLALEFLPRH
jgi:hypothetical protein